MATKVSSTNSVFRNKLIPMVAALAALGVAETASAETISLSLSDFVIFSGGGTTMGSNSDTEIGGHNLVNGTIGSNYDTRITGPTQIYGSVYNGGDLYVGSSSAIGSDGVTLSPDLQSSTRYASPVIYPALSAEVVVNGYANFLGGNSIFGNVYSGDVRLATDTAVRQVGGIDGNLEYTGIFDFNSGADVQGLTNGVLWGPATNGTTPSAPAPLGSTKTFGAISMTSGVSYTATGTNQAVDGTDFLALAPGPSNTYGSLSTTAQNQTVRLDSSGAGEYYFDSITAQGGFTLEIDLSSGQAININIVNGALFGQDTVLKVKGAGTGGVYVPISDVPELAALINWELGGTFDLGGGDDANWTSIFGGTVYSALASGDGVVIDQRVDWYGALYAYDTVDIADHSRFTYVSAIPVPAAVWLFASGLIGMVGIARRRKTA